MTSSSAPNAPAASAAAKDTSGTAARSRAYFSSSSATRSTSFSLMKAWRASWSWTSPSPPSCARRRVDRDEGKERKTPVKNGDRAREHAAEEHDEERGEEGGVLVPELGAEEVRGQVDDDRAVREGRHHVERVVHLRERPDVLDAARFDASIPSQVLVRVEAEDDQVQDGADRDRERRRDREEDDVAVGDRARRVPVGSGFVLVPREMKKRRRGTR